MTNAKAYEIMLDVKKQLEGLDETKIYPLKNAIEYRYNDNEILLEITTTSRKVKYHLSSWVSCGHGFLDVDVYFKNDSEIPSKITYRRDGIFKNAPYTNKAMGLNKIEGYIQELINNIKVKEARIKEELEFQELFNTTDKDLTSDPEPKKVNTVKKLTKQERMQLYQVISDLEDKMFNFYDVNSEFLDCYFELGKHEISVSNMNNIFISMANNSFFNEYKISAGIENQCYIELILNSDGIEITNNFEDITLKQFIKLFDQVYEALDKSFDEKYEQLNYRIWDIQDQVQCSI